jgi:hypothetical protein
MRRSLHVGFERKSEETKPMQFFRFSVFVVAITAAVAWVIQPSLRATNHDVFISEVMAGANGNSRIQFIEVTQRFGGQNLWGPQVAPGTPGADADDDDGFFGVNETASRAMLLFFDGQGREIGRFKFPENPPTRFSGGNGGSVLIATQGFASLPGAPVPDFIMPPFLNPVNGKVCLQGKSGQSFSIRCRTLPVLRCVRG